MSSFDISGPLEDGVSVFINFIPRFVGALVVLLIGYLIGKAVAKIVEKALQKARFDRALHASQASPIVDRLFESPSRFVGQVAYWLIFLAFVSFAVSALDLQVLNQILTGVYSYIPHVIAAILIFLVASAVSAGSARFILTVMGRTATARLITAVIPTITMSLAIFMILSQLNIAKDIVDILFTAIVGSAALGLALAFGLGGRDVARDLLEQAVEGARQNAGQARADVQRASANAKRRAQQTRDENLS